MTQIDAKRAACNDKHKGENHLFYPVPSTSCFVFFWAAAQSDALTVSNPKLPSQLKA